jgi:hypothetical protein
VRSHLLIPFAPFGKQNFAFYFALIFAGIVIKPFALRALQLYEFVFLPGHILFLEVLP